MTLEALVLYAVSGFLFGLAPDKPWWSFLVGLPFLVIGGVVRRWGLA